MRKKKILATLLISTTILGSTIVSLTDNVFAETQEIQISQLNQKDWKITYKDKIATITDYTGKEKNVVIPTVKDLKNWDNMYEDIKEVHITVGGMQAAAKVANEHFGTLTVSGNGGQKVIADEKNWSNLFESDYQITAIDLTNLDTSHITNMAFMFYGTSNLEVLNIANWNTSNVTSMAGMFVEASNLKSLNLSNWDTVNVTNMRAMFEDTNNLQELDLANWDVSNVTNMMNLFEGANNLQRLNLTNWKLKDDVQMNNLVYYYGEEDPQLNLLAKDAQLINYDFKTDNRNHVVVGGQQTINNNRIE